MFSYLDLKKSEEEIANETEKLHGSADGIWEKCKEHAEASKYGHYIQLHMGQMTFCEGLVKFLSLASKIPNGKLEFIFNHALQFIGGGKFEVENGFD